MRFNAAAVLSTALLAGAAHAQAEVKDTEASAAVDSAVLPSFTPTKIKGDFVEQFTDDWEQRWKPSHAKKDMKGSDVDEEWAYVGEWAVEEPHVFKGMDGDKGLVVKNAAAHHAISAKFPKPIENKGKTLVVQYEVKLQNGLECGGAYLKLLRDNKALHQEEFANSSPYVIMFGPDKCGHTNKVHFIVNHKNPKTGEYEEKHMNSPPTAQISKTTELYTLIVHPNSTFAIRQNGKQVKEGSLLEDFTPSFNPEKEIDDAKDSKPDTWVDEARIADPEAKKPEDWNEEAPFEIVDEEAEMPADWLETEAQVIPDPEALKPEDWDDEEDGDWIAPSIPNPKCEEASGCGPWTKPMKANPEYKGKWVAPLIDNPDYKGVWAPRKIKNPNYYEDKKPSNLEPMGAIGFEIWTMQNDILFDNIYIGHSIADAEALAAETFDVKHAAEKAAELAAKPKAEDKPKSDLDIEFGDDPVKFVKQKLDLFITIAKHDPIEAIKYVPEVAIGAGVGALTLLGVLVGLLTLGSAPAPKVKAAAKQGKAAVKEGKEKAGSAAASAVDAGKSEVNKRTTRSNAAE
ncbi:hypothetical protein V499_05712 [Pseudogymnoascus sp. VKM F-103]|uniref:Calnexin n=1 Tax=Pseudogymnoascus verrucosus TaxID=342668 RepID=A0A1B8GCY6_9PEZI|nr:uncharacterized protein VE01_08153 [Pseudogymnoascus verrucosus]KFY74256.1 hypothetical protein V499_05712 [Pseudogymnoascus sp. VKM F-103]OBT93709.1 hypothetical protein VE01_08153 [Pseudogymnoascus verrucosus]